MANVAFEEGLQRAEGRRQDREAHDALQRQFLASQYQTYANNIRLPDPAADPEGYKKALDLKTQALDAMQKVYSPDHHASLAEHIHGLIFGPKPAQGAPQSAQAPTLPTTPAAAPGTAPVTPVAPPAHPFDHHPVYSDIIKGLDALGSRLKGAVEPNGPKQPLPKLSSFAAVPTDSQTKAEEAEHLQKLKNEGQLAAVEARGKNPTGRPVPFGRGSVSVKDAQELHQGGTEFKDQDGNEIDVTKLPESEKLTPWAWGNKIFYTVGDQVPRIVKADNLVTAQPEEGALTPAAEVPPEGQLGAARVPTTGTHQVPGMNPGERITLTSTTTPVTPTKLTPVTPGQANRDAINGKLNSKKSKSRQVPGPDSAVGAPPPPFAPGTMLTQGRNAEPVVASMSTVAAQVFGGNGEPPLWSNAWMFDNPELRTAMNKALTLNALAIPGTEDDPSFTQTLATSLGITGWTQEQIQSANIKAREDLQRLGGDQATEMFARMAGMQEDLSALRSATKGSAAQSSIRTLVRAAPIYNVASSKNFRDQLGVTLNTAAAAMSGYPAISPKYIQWWKDSARAAKGNPVSSQAPQVGAAKHKPGDKVKLKNGQTITIKNVYPDGSFD